MPASPYWCCCASGSCDCTLRDTVYGQTIDTGCCHLDDELILWCNRPGFSNEVWQSCSVGEVHYKVEWAECLPIVALYKYFGCFYRVAYPPPLQGAEALCNLPRKCSLSGCSGPPPSGTTICEPGNVDWDFTVDPCCQQNPFPADCNCGHTWLSDRRRFVMQDGDVRYPSPCKWLDEMACYANGASVCGSGSLYQQFLGVVYFERHWKIPDGVFSKDFCPPGVRIYIPPCDNCTEAYDPNPSTAVPYWFAYAGAGVPLFLCDVDDALQHGVIEAQEYIDLLTALYSRLQPDQAVLCKMRDYFSPGDWRDEQVAAWQQLDTRFPEAGYDNCPSAPCDLPLLGPFRKRCVPTQCVTNQQACLRRSLMTPTHQQLNPVCGEIPYPGACSGEGAAADFAYWRDRQWSYWRGVEGGWAWGCADLTPEAFLAGTGRNSLNCVLGLRNEVRCDPTYTNLPCRPTANPCCGYQGGGCSGCLTVGCAPFTANYTCLGQANFVCEGLAVQPQCQGIRFNGFKYILRQNLSQPVDPLSSCLFNAWSFLVSAKRSTRWDGTCPMSCVAQDPPLGVFNSWPALAPGVLGERVICQFLDTGAPGPYGTASLCCGNHCPTTDANACIWFEELEGTTSVIRNPCVPTTQCPPTLTADQQTCLGYNPSCP
jgi:hypothetical protein